MPEPEVVAIVRDSPRGDRVDPTLVVLTCIIGTLVGVSLVAIIIQHRSYVFDDAFITYRYALNLAEGFGISWNRGELPIEGYTNFLLVVALAPFIHAGIDPLVVSRVLALWSAAGLAIIIASFARRYHAADTPTAILVGLGFLTISMSFPLSMVGLETLPFSFLLFLAFYGAILYIDSGNQYAAVLFCVSQFAAFPTRPEALLLTPCVLAIIAIHRPRAVGARVLDSAVFVVCLIVPVVTYLFWKWSYFGSLLPNSFYVKADGASIISPVGTGSLILYAWDEAKLIAIVVVTAILNHDASPQRRLCVFITVAFVAFFLHVDTLMDEYGRFLYPITPFLYVLALPSIIAIIGRFVLWRGRRTSRVLAGVAIYVTVFFVSPIDTFTAIVRTLSGTDSFADPSSLMQKEAQTGRALSSYPDIKHVTIALADAGLIPYLTQATVVDLVGLNDSYIARELDSSKVIDYVFSQKPTLMILPSDKNRGWITYGHGKLGDYTKWSGDPRWDAYTYIGTVVTRPDTYDLQIVARRDDPRFASLSTFVKKYVADVVYERLPLSIGTAR